LFLLGIIAGSIQIFIAVFKLGDLTRYVSESVILGFMAGAGLLIGLGQIGNFVGAAKKGTADQSVLVNTWLTLRGATFNPHAIGLGIGTIAVVLLLHRLFTKYKLPRLDMLAGLILASLVAAFFGWSSPAPSGATVVSVVGTIPAALPSFHIPEIDFEWFSRLIRGALAVALLGLLEALAVAKSIATYTRQPLDYNRQCLARASAMSSAAFFSACRLRFFDAIGDQLPIRCHHPRFRYIFGNHRSRCRSLARPLRALHPKSVLAGLLFITAARLIDWKRLGFAIRASRFDAALVAATAFTAIFISVEDSILVGVTLSILLFVPRAAKPGIRELISTPERVVRERLPGEERATSLLIYDLEGELFFGAAPELSRYLNEIIEEAERSGKKYVVCA